jgi:hypothetical protein
MVFFLFAGGRLMLVPARAQKLSDEVQTGEARGAPLGLPPHRQQGFRTHLGDICEGDRDG